MAQSLEAAATCFDYSRVGCVGEHQAVCASSVWQIE